MLFCQLVGFGRNKLKLRETVDEMKQVERAGDTFGLANLYIQFKVKNLIVTKFS